jgi:hypothetical protein
MMSLSNAKTIGHIRKSSQAKREYKPMMRLLDQIPASTQEMIWIWYQEGMTRRQMSQTLIELGVPSPLMTVPWGENALRKVIEKYKAMEKVNGQTQ